MRSLRFAPLLGGSRRSVGISALVVAAAAGAVGLGCGGDGDAGLGADDDAGDGPGPGSSSGGSGSGTGGASSSGSASGGAGDAGVEPTPTEGPDGGSLPVEGGSVDGGDAGPGPGPGPTPTVLRVMSYNIKYGSVVDLDLAKIAAVVKTNNPDVLGLQEVDQLTNRSGKKAETDELSRLTGMPYRYFGAAFDFDGGKYGGAILSKYPLVSPRTIRLDAHTSRANGVEPRIAVAAEVTMGTKTITFVSLHASLVGNERGINGLAVTDALGAKAATAIVVGDFNETPNQALGQRLKGAGLVDTFGEKHPLSLGFTASATFPTRRIDFAYRGARFGATQHAWVSDTRASDHRPVACVVPMY